MFVSGNTLNLQLKNTDRDLDQLVKEMCEKLLANTVIEDLPLRCRGGCHPMKFAVIVFPGSNCDVDMYHAIKDALGEEVEYVWHATTI